MASAQDRLLQLERHISAILSEGFTEALSHTEIEATQLIEDFCAQLIEIVTRQGIALLTISP